MIRKLLLRWLTTKTEEQLQMDRNKKVILSNDI